MGGGGKIIKSGRKPQKKTVQNKGFGEMPSARLDSHRNSVQNGVVESFPAPTGTIFVNVFDFWFFLTFFASFFWQNQQSPLNKPPGEGNSQNRQTLSKIEPERVPEMRPKHRKSLPNGRQKGAAFGAAPFGVLVVFHLVRISYVLASFPEPVLVRFSTKFADSVNFLPQGALLKGLVG